MEKNKLFSIGLFVSFGFVSFSPHGINGNPQNIDNNIVTLGVANRSNFTGLREYINGDRTNRFYHSFRGVRYAEPPVGEKRWTDPVLLDITEPFYDTTKYGNRCSQFTRGLNGTASPAGDEDCLFLNIFTPVLPVPSRSGVPSSPLLSVMVYIHAGGFMYGSAENVGPGRFMKHDVVLVTLNYRLGILGYLSTGDKNLPGNFGALDQIKALEWVRKYIRYFGGNPNSVTIFGHSAGAASVHLLTLSTRAQGKYHRAIVQSGSGLCDWSIEQNPKKYATQIGDEFGCPHSSEALVDCLREKTAQELIQVQQSKLDFWVLPGHTSPVVDAESRGADAFLKDTPENLMTNGNFSHVPIITGVTTDEGFMGYAFLHLNVTGEKFRNQTYFEEELIPRVLRNLMEKDDEEIKIVSNSVRRHYFEGIKLADDLSHKMAIKEMNELFGDYMFYSCHWNMLEKYAAHQVNPVYSYVFTHKTINSPKIMANAIRALRQQRIHHHLYDHGIPHGEDMFYYFDPMEQLPGNREERMWPIDERVADIVTRIWVSFARDGSPAGGILPGYHAWRQIRSDTINYYNLTSVPAPMGSDFRKGESLFWLRTVPHLIELGEKIENLEVYPLLFWIFLGISILLLIVSIILAVVLWRKRTTGKASL